MYVFFYYSFKMAWPILIRLSKKIPVDAIWALDKSIFFRNQSSLPLFERCSKDVFHNLVCSWTKFTWFTKNHPTFAKVYDLLLYSWSTEECWLIINIIDAHILLNSWYSVVVICIYNLTLPNFKTCNSDHVHDT